MIYILRAHRLCCILIVPVTRSGNLLRCFPKNQDTIYQVLNWSRKKLRKKGVKFGIAFKSTSTVVKSVFVPTPGPGRLLHRQSHRLPGLER